MPKVTAANAFVDLQNLGIISEEDPTQLFTNLSQIGAGNFGIVYRVCLAVKIIFRPPRLGRVK